MANRPKYIKRLTSVLLVPHRCVASVACYDTYLFNRLKKLFSPHVQSCNRKDSLMAGFPPTFDWVLSQQWLTHNVTLAKDQAEACLKSFATFLFFFFFHHRHFDLLAGKSTGVANTNDNWVPSSSPAITLEITPPNWNATTINVVNYTCVFPVITSQHVCCTLAITFT